MLTNASARNGLRVADGDAVAAAGLAAALQLFEAQGLGAITLRAVAERTGVPPAAIQRRFEFKERLLLAVLSAFLEDERARLDQLCAVVGEAPMPMATVPGLLCADADAPALAPRRVMLIEFLIAAVRNPSLRPLAQEWFETARRTWNAAIGEDETSAVGAFITEIQTAVILDSIGCGGSVYLHLANVEVAETALLAGGAAKRFWFGRLLEACIADADDARASVALQSAEPILQAGSDILIHEGPDAVTFRSVAARANATFSAVASTFRRKEALLAAICDHMVMRAMDVAPPPLTGPRDLAQVCEITCDMLTGGGCFEGRYFFMGSVELRLLAARNPMFAGLARRLRLMNGLYPLRKDDAAYDPFGPEAFAVHSRSSWAQGCALILGATERPEDLRQALLNRLLACAPNFEVARRTP